MKKITISRGLEVSREILDRLKKREDLLVDVSIGAFTNCREVGYTYSVTEGKFEDWFTFCTYEHRNSDQIIINGKKGLVSQNGDLPYGGKGQWSVLETFNCEDYDGATNKLVELLNSKIGKTN